eukprot:TCONS_00059073-protein
MVQITEDLIRKRSEHNDCEITTLEEISLHQCDIERLEYIGKWCRDLKILYLQSNLIPKIENIHQLKKLEYLNLALNNILVIENLKGCESLKKLDLTVNFVGKITSIESLKGNEFLRDMYLTGNPCTEYVGYRDYVIATLPQLTSLDGTPVSKSERIKANQKLTELRCDMLRQEKIYMAKQDKEQEIEEIETNGVKKEKMTEEEFWSKPSKFTPQSRVEAHHFMEEKRKEKEETKKTDFPDLRNSLQRTIRFFTDDGRPLNINQDKIDFEFQENDDFTGYVLDVACYKHLDTSLIDVDLQPHYVRVTMKGKILQLSLNEEISPDKSTAQRSQTSGHLLINMPKLKYILEGRCSGSRRPKTDSKGAKMGSNEFPDATKTRETKTIGCESGKTNTDDLQKSVERLEVTENENKIDYTNIVKEENEKSKDLNSFIFNGKKRKGGSPMKNNKNAISENQYDEHFVDDLDVPPLE